ncbi:MAG: hypothetical protein WC732_09415, partial [Candidatus Omnitrophota bacterium]
EERGKASGVSTFCQPEARPSGSSAGKSHRPRQIKKAPFGGFFIVGGLGFEAKRAPSEERGKASGVSTFCQPEARPSGSSAGKSHRPRQIKKAPFGGFFVCGYARGFEAKRAPSEERGKASGVSTTAFAIRHML